MFSVCVLEQGGSEILDFLKAEAGAWGKDFDFDDRLRKPHYDFILWHETKRRAVASAAILAVLDEQAHIAVGCVAAPIVATYGVLARDTLTVSADMEERVLTLQREVKTLLGNSVLPREIPIDCPLCLGKAMAAVMACIICECIKI